MREIEFRGTALNGGKWVYGYFYQADNCFDGCFIFPLTVDRQSIRVEPETVGQFTGLKDKNGVKIFEGDIVLYDGSKTDKRIVSFKNGSFIADNPRHKICTFKITTTSENPDFLTQYEVVGNIHGKE